MYPTLRPKVFSVTPFLPHGYIHMKEYISVNILLFGQDRRDIGLFSVREVNKMISTAMEFCLAPIKIFAQVSILLTPIPPKPVAVPTTFLLSPKLCNLSPIR